MVKYKISEYQHAFLGQSAIGVDKHFLVERTINSNLITESITFGVDGYDYGANPDTFYDAMTYIGRKIVNDVIRKFYTDSQLRAMGFYFTDMFAPDGGSNDVMNIYLGDFYNNEYPQLIGLVTDSLDKTVKSLPNVRINGGITFEDSKSRDSKVIRVPLIVEPSEENAPEMQLANGNAAALLNALGLPFDDYSGKYSVQLLLGQIAVTRSKLSGMPIPDKSYMKDITPKAKPAQFGTGELGAKVDVGNVKKQAFPAPALNEDIYANQMGKDQLMRYLDRLEEMCHWAIDHGYTEISFG